MNEAKITINGVKITSAMSSTIRVAIENFRNDLIFEGLGDDEHGKEMAALYLARIDEIRRVMHE